MDEQNRNQPAPGEGKGQASFTPGPWVVNHGESYTGGVCISEEWFVQRPGDDVAIAADIFDPITDLPSEANARLIAAAPDLLAACEETENLLAGYDMTPEERGLWLTIKQAIAQARGEARP